MAVKGVGNVEVTYDSVDITPYINEAELAITIAELEGTNLASTVAQFAPSLPSYQLTLKGDWISAVDAKLGVDAVTPTTRVVIVKFTDENAAFVQYSFSACFITGYSITGSAGGKIEHAPTIRMAGTLTRTTT
jgi:hypothetical protein